GYFVGQNVGKGAHAACACVEDAALRPGEASNSSVAKGCRRAGIVAPVQKNDTVPAGPARDGLPAPQRLWAMAAILLGITLSVLDASIVNLALPDITRDFGASASAAIWVVNAYQLATLGLLLPCAHMGDRFGYRRVYLVGLAV